MTCIPSTSDFVDMLVCRFLRDDLHTFDVRFVDMLVCRFLHDLHQNMEILMGLGLGTG